MAALDPVTAKQVMEDFVRINRDMNISILINIHHVELALTYANRIIGIRAGQIVFFLARWGAQAVGLCSVSPCFSTFACGEVGSFEDFYLEPCFRGKGSARLLANAARDWCR